MEFTPEQEVMRTVISRCWEDEEFKQELLASPVEAIKKATGKTIQLPDGVKMVVVDQTDPSYVHINIPAEPNLEDAELTDNQLEAVAGGRDLSLDFGLLVNRAPFKIDI